MNRDLARMIDWLGWAVLCYAIVLALHAWYPVPQLETVLWKLGNLTVAAYVGYWLDRRAFRMRIDVVSPELEQIRRAIVMAAAMIAVALGL